MQQKLMAEHAELLKRPCGKIMGGIAGIAAEQSYAVVMFKEPPPSVKGATPTQVPARISARESTLGR